MSKKNVSAIDPNKRNIEFIWDSLAFALSDEDFQAIQLALIKREETIEDIETSKVSYRYFDKGDMYEPCPVSDIEKRGALKYADWSCAVDILSIISKYCDFYDHKVH